MGSKNNLLSTELAARGGGDVAFFFFIFFLGGGLKDIFHWTRQSTFSSRLQPQLTILNLKKMLDPLIKSLFNVP